MSLLSSKDGCLYDIVCNNCKGSEFQRELKLKDYFLTQEEFEIISCKGCGLSITYPQPDKNVIYKYYDSDEYISHSDKRRTFFDKVYHLIRSFTLNWKLSLVKKYVDCGKILDFGCGTGYFLDICQKGGFEVYGVEPNEKARGNLVNKGIVVKERIEEFSEDEKFDVITLWHVLEHLYEPKDFMFKASRYLNKYGYLIIAVPNKNSFDAKYYDAYWAGYDVPRHLYHFTRKDLINITSGIFELVDVKPMLFDSFYVSMLSERYKKSRLWFIRGFFIGLLSNVSALWTNEYSSVIYVFRKV